MPEPGAGLPRLKLCAHCVSVNLALVNAPKKDTVPGSAYEVAQQIRIAPPAAAGTAPLASFAHLLGEDGESQAALAMMEQKQETSAIDSAGHGVPGDPAPTVCSSQPMKQPAEIPVGPEDDSDPAGPLATLGAIEIAKDLWVGGDKNVEFLFEAESPHLSVLSAAKDPWHRQMVGYATKSAPEGDERLWARRGNHMALNLVDVAALGPKGAFYVPQAVIDKALEFIEERIAAGDQVLVHCNRGRSRAPGIGFIYLRKHGFIGPRDPLDEAIAEFRKVYPEFEPSAGMRRYLETVSE